jgi:hypothetical protein
MSRRFIMGCFMGRRASLSLLRDYDRTPATIQGFPETDVPPEQCRTNFPDKRKSSYAADRSRSRLGRPTRSTTARARKQPFRPWRCGRSSSWRSASKAWIHPVPPLTAMSRIPPVHRTNRERALGVDFVEKVACCADSLLIQFSRRIGGSRHDGRAAGDAGGAVLRLQP